MNIKPIIIVIFLLIIQSIYGQIENVKIDTIYDVKGNIHRVINNTFDKELDYYELAIKCKIKADSLLMEHFDLEFFNNKIFLDGQASIWFSKEERIPQLKLIDFNNKKKPKRVELRYSILEKNSTFFNLIEITINCENGIKIINTQGVPKTKKFKINIDYKQAKKIARRKGFRDNKKDEFYNKYSSDIETLSLEFSEDNIYQWEIHKNVKREIGKQVGSCSSVTTHSKVLYINAETGKTKIEKIEFYGGSVHWY